MVKKKTKKKTKKKKSARKKDVPMWYFPIIIIALGVLVFILALLVFR